MSCADPNGLLYSPCASGPAIHCSIFSNEKDNFSQVDPMAQGQVIQAPQEPPPQGLTNLAPTVQRDPNTDQATLHMLDTHSQGSLNWHPPLRQAQRPRSGKHYAKWNGDFQGMGAGGFENMGDMFSQCIEFQL